MSLPRRTPHPQHCRASGSCGTGDGRKRALPAEAARGGVIHSELESRVQSLSEAPLPTARQEDRVCHVCCSWGHFSHLCRDARFPHRKAPPTGELCEAQTLQGCPAPAPFVYLSQLLTFVGHIILGSGIFSGSCCQCDSDFQMVISCAPI